MPCHSAIVEKNVTVKADETVENALKALRKGKVSAVAVLGEDQTFLGFFSMKVLLRNLIPVSVAVTEGVQMDITLPAAPGVAKRLQNMMLLSVSDIMDRKPVTLEPDAPVWKAVSLLTKNGNPLTIIDDKDRFYGFITYDSLVSDLENFETTDS